MARLRAATRTAARASSGSIFGEAPSYGGQLHRNMRRTLEERDAE